MRADTEDAVEAEVSVHTPETSLQSCSSVFTEGNNERSLQQLINWFG